MLNYDSPMPSQYENVIELIKHLEQLRYPTSFQELLQQFGWSRPTLFRAMKAAEEQGHHIVNIRGEGYKLEARTDLPQLTAFTASEMEGLAVLWQMLEHTQNEWISQYDGLKSALMEQLRNHGVPIENWEGRVQYIPQHRRHTPTAVFRKASQALIHRKALKIIYQTYGKPPESREIHPQQLVLYRNGWILNALDPSRIRKEGPKDLGIRQFSMDLISKIQISKTPWIEVPISQLKKTLREGYGIFAGNADAEAVLRFSGVAAFYAARECWHPQQKITKQTNGTLEMRIPYVSQYPAELLGDILRWGEDVQILKPLALKKMWKEKILRMNTKVS